MPLDESSRGTSPRKRIVSIIGTRPEAIKMAPVARALAARADLFEHVLVASGQHRDLVDGMLEAFGLRSDVDLELMEPDQTLAAFASRALAAAAELIERLRPDAVLVQGDTTTVMAASLAAFYARVPVGHVEAGLRTGRRDNPFPEEINRRLTAVVADWHFAPTERARKNLLAEGIDPDAIHVTGNTIVDALQAIETGDDGLDIPGDRRVIVVTAHRRESFGTPLHEICRALRRIARERADVEIVYPVHPNPSVAGVAHAELDGVDRVRLVEPLPYRRLLALLRRSTLVLTDSGGIQEEAPSLHVPVLVLRDATERPELIEAGAGRLVGTREDSIVGETLRLLDDRVAYESMRNSLNPFGDGHAAERIVAILASSLDARRSVP